jgi:hypothetical protein
MRIRTHNTAYHTHTWYEEFVKRVHGCREMLDSSKDSLKLDAMKRIIAMLAKVNDPKFSLLLKDNTISAIQTFC